jgi:hypothetical protein
VWHANRQPDRRRDRLAGEVLGIKRAVIATSGGTLQMPSAGRRAHRPDSPGRTLAQVGGP